MTTETEMTRRALYGCLDRIRRAAKHRVLTAEFEERLEEHLEALRKDAKEGAPCRAGGEISSEGVRVVPQWADLAIESLVRGHVTILGETADRQRESLQWNESYESLLESTKRARAIIDRQRQAIRVLANELTEATKAAKKISLLRRLFSQSNGN